MNFKELRNKLQPNPKKVELNKENTSPKIVEPLEAEEARYLLNLIAQSDFKGKDVQILYNIAYKLQNLLSSYLDKNE